LTKFSINFLAKSLAKYLVENATKPPFSLVEYAQIPVAKNV
jgi:hypothetical protein